MNKVVKMIFVVIVFLSDYSLVFSQAVTWQKWYDYNNYEDNGQDVIQTFDGGYIILSNNYVPLNNSSVLTKIDQFGNVQWQKQFNRNNVGGLSLLCYAVTQNSDTGYLISGGNRDSAIIIRTDKTGELMWFKKYSRAGFQAGVFRDHKLTNDGGIIACGRLYDPAVGYVVKTDSIGNILWDSLYNFSSIIFKIIESKDSCLYMLGFGTNFVKPTYSLTKLTSVGIVIWNRDSDLSTADLIEHTSGNIYVGGGYDSLILTKLDSSGIIVFQKGYFRGVTGCYSMCLSTDRNILLAGTLNGKMAVSKIDPNGNLIFEKSILTINSPEYSFLPNAVNSTLDSGFIFTGFTDYPPNFFESNIYAAKTDSLCNAPKIVKIENNNLLIPDKFTLLQNYPNPFNPITTISYELRNSDLVELKIYDMKGVEMGIIVNEFQRAGEYRVTFNSQNYDLTSGIYFYRLKVTNFSVTKRMMLIK